MNTTALINQLASTRRVLPALVGHLSQADARRRSEAGGWSVVEIVAHLADEEADDFRARLVLTLDDPGQPWPGIDPEGWAISRGYHQRDLPAELARFDRERCASLAWLASLDAPDWSRTHEHPTIGPLAAGDLLASWAAHDLLHIRQLARRLYELVAARADPFGVRYAGELGQ